MRLTAVSPGAEPIRNYQALILEPNVSTPPPSAQRSHSCSNNTVIAVATALLFLGALSLFSVEETVVCL